MRATHKLAAILVLISLTAFSVPAQQKQSPDEKQRKIKPEPKKAYVQWFTDHELISTQSERDAWKKLATDDEREKFIEEFWRSRDPDPTPRKTNSRNSFTNVSPTQTSTSPPANRDD